MYEVLRNLSRLLLLIPLVKIFTPLLIFPWAALTLLLFSFLPPLLKLLRLRKWISFLILAVTPFLIRSFLINLFAYLSPPLSLLLDENLTPLVPFLTLFSLLTLFFNGRYRSGEVLVNGIFLVLLFWREGQYRVTYFADWRSMSLYLIFFVLIQILLLYLSRRRGSLRSLLRELPLILPLIALLSLILLPFWREYEEGSLASGGGLLKSTLFRFDFSEYISLETQISMSQELVLLYRKEGPASRLLLRRYVLSGYEKGGFFRSDFDKYGQPFGPPALLSPGFSSYPVSNEEKRALVEQEFFLVNIDPAAFFSLNDPANLQVIENWQDSSFLSIYRSEALVLRTTPPSKEEETSGDMSDELYDHYISGGHVWEGLANEIVGHEATTLGKVQKIENWLKDNYFYSLNPGIAPHGDQLTYFLEEGKKGYCSYFAFAMTLLCRALNIPSRVALGFWVDPSSPVMNFYPVRTDQAHAWVEVYFDNYGWIEFDPTSATMAPGEEYPFVTPPLEEFSSLIEEVLEQKLIVAGDEMGRVSILKEKRDTSPNIPTYSYIILIFLYLLFLLVYHILPLCRYLGAKDQRIKGRFLYLRLVRTLRLFRGRGETVIDFTKRIDSAYGIDLERITSLYLKAVFSQFFSKDNLGEMERESWRLIRGYRDTHDLFYRIVRLFIPFGRKR